MKRNGILNAGILNILARAGHGDLIAVTDRGFPLTGADDATAVDVSVVPGIPSIADLLPPLAKTTAVEGVIVAEETHERNEAVTAAIRSAFAGVPEETVPHAAFKEIVLGGGRENHRLIGQIRTGEFTRYGNVILICGVAF